MIKKFKNTVSWIYVISGLKGEEIVRRFCKNEIEKPNKKEFKGEKIITTIATIVLFNSWIDKV